MEVVDATSSAATIKPYLETIAHLRQQIKLLGSLAQISSEDLDCLLSSPAPHDLPLPPFNSLALSVVDSEPDRLFPAAAYQTFQDFKSDFSEDLVLSTLEDLGCSAEWATGSEDGTTQAVLVTAAG